MERNTEFTREYSCYLPPPVKVVICRKCTKWVDMFGTEVVDKVYKVDLQPKKWICHVVRSDIYRGKHITYRVGDKMKWIWEGRCTNCGMEWRENGLETYHPLYEWEIVHQKEIAYEKAKRLGRG